MPGATGLGLNWMVEPNTPHAYSMRFRPVNFVVRSDRPSRAFDQLVGLLQQIIATADKFRQGGKHVQQVPSSSGGITPRQ
jgi:hypothetical protein